MDLLFDTISNAMRNVKISENKSIVSVFRSLFEELAHNYEMESVERIYEILLSYLNQNGSYNLFIFTDSKSNYKQ